LRVTQVEMFVNGPGVFGWFKDQADQVQTLNIVHEEGMKVAIALPQKATSPKVDVYTAKNYDILIDSPFAVSRNLRTSDFQVSGKRHVVAAFNQPEGADLDAFSSVCSRAAEGALALFGELPYDSYWFLFDFGGGGGGLEHLDSTKIGLSPRANAQQSAGIIFHEYFHAFNVKRIRSKPLGPFDYTKPAVTGAIWWLEGVTDYYADVLAVRTGVETRDEFLRAMAGTFTGFHRGTGFARTSADDSSRRVWETSGSNGFGGVSYYTKGKLVGMALDLAIRGASNGRRSLDDVMRDLYAETKGKDGFSETRIRELCIKHGGEGLGPIYDVCVMQAVRIPIEGILAGVGLSMTDGAIASDPGADQSSAMLGRRWPMAVTGK
jgi:predicted metalloprotease with PDZ domain